jgi:polar amino acid transport system ATP-binding protein
MRAPDEKRPLLDVWGLHKEFDGKPVLRDVNLRINPGETLCLLGPSGSGKSTLLRCINWLERPDAGHVMLDGEMIGYRAGGIQPMSDAELALVRTRIGMVFQHFALWPHLTVLGNIIEAPVHALKRRKGEAIEEAQILLRKVGLQDKADVYPATLSGGQKQRVGIARALAVRPILLLFDEPTSALDPELVGEVLAVMRDLTLEGTTMLVVTHEMGFARDAATRVAFIDQGRILENTGPEQFFTAPETERARQFLQRYAAQTARSTKPCR